MTLKEKLQQVTYWWREATECEKIADDHAIEFVEWFWYHGRKYWRGERTDYLDMSEILEIFKKEKGL